MSLLTYCFLTGYFRNPHVWFVFLFSSQRSLRIKILIGKTGFEPATPWSQTKYSTKLSYFPKYAPCRIRTCNRLIRSQVLYPVEPRVHHSIKFYTAEDRNRTGTKVTLRRILSPVRLPVPPPRPLTSERRGSNPRPPPWQGGVLPLNYVRIKSILYAGYMT